MNRLQFCHLPVESQVSVGTGLVYWWVTPCRTCGFGFTYVWSICVASSSIMCHLNMFWKHLVSKLSVVFFTDLTWFSLGFGAHMWQCFGVAGGHKHLEIHPQFLKNPKTLETTSGPLIAQLLTLKLCSWGEIWYRNLLFHFNALKSRLHNKLSFLVSWISQKNSNLRLIYPFFFQLYQQGRLCQLGSEFCELEVFAKVLRALDKRWVS